MAIVYDVLQIVTPEAASHCSYKAGTQLACFRATRKEAEDCASIFNSRCGMQGVSYVVNEIDEEDPARAYDSEYAKAIWKEYGRWV